MSLPVPDRHGRVSGRLVRLRQQAPVRAELRIVPSPPGFADELPCSIVDLDFVVIRDDRQITSVRAEVHMCSHLVHGEEALPGGRVPQADTLVFVGELPGVDRSRRSVLADVEPRFLLPISISDPRADRSYLSAVGEVPDRERTGAVGDENLLPATGEPDVAEPPER